MGSDRVRAPARTLVGEPMRVDRRTRLGVRWVNNSKAILMDERRRRLMTAGLGTYWLGPEEGDAVWMLGALYTWKALGAQTGGDYSICEVRGPAGFAAPLHSHERENEGFYVASGEVTLVLADAETSLMEGGFGFAPAGAPHTFRLDSPEARLLLFITPGAAGHEGMFAEMGEPATARVLPAPPEGPPDFASLAAIAAKHGTTILGPPPSADS